MLRNIPSFGRTAASRWLWTINLSPGYLGQGIITGLPVSLNMLAGAIVGWGILSPVAKAKGWAPGPVNDWDTGSRGWTVRISLSIMLADAFVHLVSFSLAALLPALRSKTHIIASPAADDDIYTRPEPSRWLAPGLLLAALVCLLSVKVAFGGAVPTLVVVLAIALTLPSCLMGIHAVGSTDHNPASSIAKISQLIVGALPTRDASHDLVGNLVAGGVTESGVVTAGFLLQMFKTASLVGASPTLQLLGMLYGTVIGGVIGTGFYRLYTSVYDVPGEPFGIPTVFVWRAGAQLAVGQGLPPKVPEVALGMGLCFFLFSLVRIYRPGHRWTVYVPSGIPFAVGKFPNPGPPSILVSR